MGRDCPFKRCGCKCIHQYHARPHYSPSQQLCACGDAIDVDRFSNSSIKRIRRDNFDENSEEKWKNRSSISYIQSIARINEYAVWQTHNVNAGSHQRHHATTRPTEQIAVGWYRKEKMNTFSPDGDELMTAEWHPQSKQNTIVSGGCLVVGWCFFSVALLTALSQWLAQTYLFACATEMRSFRSFYVHVHSRWSP